MVILFILKDDWVVFSPPPLHGLLCCYMVVVSSKAVDPLSVIDLDFPISSGAGNYLISSPDNV